MATKSIQASGGDYATVALWEAYLEGIGTLAADEIGQINNEELSSTAGVTFQNIIPGVFHVILEAQPGDSFRDNANKATNALRYNSANGACWTHNSSDPMMTIDIPNFTIRNLMLKKVANYARMLHYIDNANTDNIIENCIVDGAPAQEYLIDARNLAIRNSVILDSGSNNTARSAVLGSGGVVDIVNCVVAKTSAASAPDRIGLLNSYATMTVVNTAVLGVATDASGTIGGTNNATDKATGGLPATNRQNSLVAATEFESVTNGSEDFRLKSTSVKCKDNGTASGSPTPPSADIVGQVRAGNTDIGVWEFQSGGGGSPAARERVVGGGYWY